MARLQVLRILETQPARRRHGIRLGELEHRRLRRCGRDDEHEHRFTGSDLIPFAEQLLADLDTVDECAVGASGIAITHPAASCASEQ